MNVLWDFEGPPANDRYVATFRGTKSRSEVRQGKEEDFRPEVYIVPNSPELKTEVGEVLWLNEARRGHEMLAGAPHRRGKIVIKVAD